MKIQVGKYTLRSDQYCMWVDEEYIIEEGKHKGELDTRRVAGYCTDITRLLNDFRQKKTWGSDAESLEELIEVVRGVFEDLKALDKAALENDFKTMREMKK